MGNVFETCSTHSSVKKLLRECKGAGVTFLVPTDKQRPWSPPIGYQCVYESYFRKDTKLWFPIPRLITSCTFCLDVAISHFLKGSLCIAVALMVMAAEIDISMSVRTFKELTFLKHMHESLYSVKMRPSYNILTRHPNKTHN